MGYVDYENLYGIKGVGLANIIANVEEVDGRRAQKQLQMHITFDDGCSWARLHPPRSGVSCNVDDDACSLHLHSVTIPHNFGRVFALPAPGFVVGVGSVGAHLRPHEECDTFLSTEAGLTWSWSRWTRIVQLDSNYQHVPAHALAVFGLHYAERAGGTHILAMVQRSGEQRAR